MSYVAPLIHTVCIGQASSTASLLLAAGAKGHRTILPNATVMLTQVRPSSSASTPCPGSNQRVAVADTPTALSDLLQPYGGHQGQQTDIGIAAKEVLRQRDLLEGLYWEHCKLDGESLEDGKKRFRTFSPSLNFLSSHPAQVG